MRTHEQGFWPAPAYAPNDGGGAGGEAAPDGGAPAGGAPPAGSAPATEPPPPAVRADGKPAWLPEKFKSEEDFTKSYKELEQKQFSRREDLKKETRAEIEAERRAAVPTSPGDYTFEPIKLPDGRQVQLNAEDPLVPWFQDRAHKMGLSQEQYGELVKDFVQQDLRRGPVWEKEVEKLGVDAAQADLRLQRIEGWMRGNAPQEIYDAFSGVPATAGMIRMFEHIMTLAGEPSFRLDDSGGFAGTVTPDSVQTMMKDERYWKARDPIYVTQVRAAMRKLAGER
jgi:hypothetical protein